MGVAHFIDKFFLLSVIPLKVETKVYKENAYSSGCYCNNSKSAYREIKLWRFLH